MRAFTVACLISWGMAACADSFQVTRLADEGTGSLRWALRQARWSEGPDTITFAPDLAGEAIRPLTALPTIDDDETTLDGDIDGDGDPDIAVSGQDCADYTALQIASSHNTIRGLCIKSWFSYGIHALPGSGHNTIAGCYFGCDIRGQSARENRWSDLHLEESHDNTIGGASPVDRNVFACGNTDLSGNGVYISYGRRNTVVGNLFGLGPDGQSVLGSGRCKGVRVFSGAEESRGNQIGGQGAGEGNVFAGLSTAVELYGTDTHDNIVEGNIIGLAADGTTPAGCETGVWLYGCHHNTVGGTDPGAGNTISACDRGIKVDGTSCTGNKIRGNLLGLSADGSRSRANDLAIDIYNLAGGNKIGGVVPEAGNYFVTGDDSSFGIYMYGAGADNVVSMNKFGMHTDGSDATLWKGIHLYNTTCRIDDNEFVGAIHSGIGVDTSTDYTSPTIARNIFRKCEWGVHIYPKGKANLGNLANSRTRDDGGNTFRLSNTWHIQNHSPYRIRAEGNDFRTTVGAEINEKLWDQRDNAALGKVDFSPLEGGVRPSGDVEGLLSIIGAAVAPTTAGAQITFTLTADASVTARVLNIAGRPAKTLCTARDSQTGANTLLWNARTDSGLAAPNGTYLVEVIASSDDGSQARAVAPVRLAR